MGWLSAFLQLLPIILLLLKEYLTAKAAKEAKVDDNDKNIDSANNADDLLRQLDKLRK